MCHSPWKTLSRAPMMCHSPGKTLSGAAMICLSPGKTLSRAPSGEPPLVQFARLFELHHYYTGFAFSVVFALSSLFSLRGFEVIFWCLLCVRLLRSIRRSFGLNSRFFAFRVFRIFPIFPIFKTFLHPHVFHPYETA